MGRLLTVVKTFWFFEQKRLCARVIHSEFLHIQILTTNIFGHGLALIYGTADKIFASGGEITGQIKQLCR